MAVALPKYLKDINANLTNKGNGGIKWGLGAGGRGGGEGGFFNVKSTVYVIKYVMEVDVLITTHCLQTA